MAAPLNIPLQHRYLEHLAPGTDRLDERGAYFGGLGEWPHALSAMLTASRALGTTDGRRAAAIENLRDRWRIADGDADIASELRGYSFKRMLQFTREQDRLGNPSLMRRARSLREAHRQEPNDIRVQHLLTITYLGLLDITVGLRDTPLDMFGASPNLLDTSLSWVDTSPESLIDPVYRDYLGIDDPNELAARVDHLVESKRAVPHWLIVCPNSSGTWQLCEYVRHVGEFGRSRFLADVHKNAKQRFSPVRAPIRRLGWLAFSHLSKFTNMRLVIAGNLHDPIQALTTTITRKVWQKQLEGVLANPLNFDTPPPEQAIETVHATVQNIVDGVSTNDLSEYFYYNYERLFGFPLNMYQIQNKKHGYFVGFHKNLTFVLTILTDLESALAPMLENVLCIETSDCRPASDFRITSSPVLSSHLRNIVNRISVPPALVDSSIETRFMEQHFRPDQLQAMRDRWSPKP